MSDLQRSYAKAHLAKLPPEPPPILDERDEDEDELSKLPLESPVSDSSSSASSTGTIVPSPGRNLFERPKGSTTSRNKFTPLPWSDFFAQELYFDRTDGDLQIKHHAYLAAPMPQGPLFVTHHGAGSSGLSFAAFTAEIQKILPKAGVLSLDARGHGSTIFTSSSTTTDPAIDLTLETLSADLVYILTQTLLQLPLPSPPPILLIGHSLGGAVITHAASNNLLTPPPLGYAVLDVVEGSALDALSSMETYLSTRPASFHSLPSAIEWHLRSRTLRNTTSARVSVPPLLSPSADAKAYTWSTNLPATQCYWSTWFTALSTKFLAPIGPAKLLLLAGTDRLDKALTIAQMQGKFQMQIFPDTGHFLHEDQPARAAGVLADFYRRNERGQLVLPRKVGEGGYGLGKMS